MFQKITDLLRQTDAGLAFFFAWNACFPASQAELPMFFPVVHSGVCISGIFLARFFIDLLLVFPRIIAAAILGLDLGDFFARKDYSFIVNLHLIDFSLVTEGRKVNLHTQRTNHLVRVANWAI